MTSTTDGILYILAVDEWYAVRTDFVAEINGAIAGIPAINLGLPAYNLGEREGDYNERAIVGRDDLFLYDRNLVAFAGERGRVEFCDLLTTIKRDQRSPGVSH